MSMRVFSWRTTQSGTPIFPFSRDCSISAALVKRKDRSVVEFVRAVYKVLTKAGVLDLAESGSSGAPEGEPEAGDVHDVVGDGLVVPGEGPDGARPASEDT